MYRRLWIWAIALLMLSCKINNQPSTLTPQPSTTAETITESTDTIVLTLDPSDSLVSPGMALVTRWPLQYDTFNGHFVLFADSLSQRVAELTLLSLKEWSDMTSAYSETPTEATDTASCYIEYGLAQWSIPSETQARRIKSDISRDILDPTARYLCEEATKSFSMAENSNVTKAGAKTVYHLRLVNTQRVARQ